LNGWLVGRKGHHAGVTAQAGLAETAPMILCDTKILIEFFKNNIQLVQELKQIGQDQLAISVITQAKLSYGV
jgi:rRNA-processing protein FCF1